MLNRIDRGEMGLLPALIFIVTLLSSSVAFAQGSIFGSVANSDLSVPLNGELSFFGYLDDTDEEIRIESCVGAGYDSGNWFDDFQNYLTEAPGNPYDYHFHNVGISEGFILSKLIPNNSFQQEDITLAPAVFPSAPANLTGRSLSNSAVVISWTGLPGETYHVYRRLATSNGSFFRIDDPTGSLANPGVSDSFFVDTGVNGTSGYAYLVIAEDIAGNLGPHSVVVTVDSGTPQQPTLSAIEPNTGYTVGGNPVLLTGNGFDPAGATATLGGAPLTSVVVVSPFELTGLTPPGVAGSVDVVVTNTATGYPTDPLVGGFTYLANSTPQLAAIGQQNVVEGANLNFDVTATDADGDSLAFSAEDVPPNATFVDNFNGSGTFDFNPDFAQAGSFFVTFIVSDGISADSEIVEIVVLDGGNQTPVLATIGAQGVLEGDSLGFAVSATDVDGDSLILFADDLPGNATFADNFDGTGTFTFKPDFDQAGQYTVTFIASDGTDADSEAVVITVADAGNQPPVLVPIGQQAVVENQNLNFVVTANDIDLDSLILSAANLPDNATLTDNFDGTGTFDFTPDFTQAGTYYVWFIASDGVFADSEEVEIVVTDAGNQSPVLAVIGPLSVYELQNLSILLTAIDADADSMVFTAQNLPPGATLTDNFDSTATFDFTPGSDQAGVYVTTFIVSDGILADSEVVTITVLEGGNQGPVFDPIDPPVIAEDSVLTLLIHATDDTDSVSFIAFTELSNYTFVDSGNGYAVVEYTPDFYSAGVESVTVIASDVGTPPLSTSLKILITIVDVNQPPTITPIPPVSKSAGDTVKIRVTATDSTDADGGLLHLFAVSKPSGSAFQDSGNGAGLFRWPTTIADTGSYQLHLLCLDDETPGMSDHEFVDITILVVNQAPILDSIGQKSVIEGDTLEFIVSASDPDGTIPTLTSENLPRRSTFLDYGDGTGIFTFLPDYQQAGLKSVKFKAGDGDKQDYENVLIQVSDNPQAPILTVPTETQMVTEGDSILFLISATDGDSTIPFLDVDSTTFPINATLVDSGNGIGLFAWRPIFVQAGTWDVYFVAYDNTDLADTAIVVIEVADAGNQTPEILAPLDGVVINGQELQRLLFTVETTDADSVPPMLSSSTLPFTATFTDNEDFTGTFDWQIANLEAGTYPVTFYANDGSDPGIVVSIDVTLEIADYNYPPDPILFDPITICFPGEECEMEMDEGDSIQFRIVSGDLDGAAPAIRADLYNIIPDTIFDTIVFVPPYEVDTTVVAETTYTAPPATMLVDNLGNDTAVFSFAPNYLQSGQYRIMFRSIDVTDVNLYSARSFLFRVYNVPVAAVLEPIGPQTLTEGDTLDIQISGYDPDGGPVTIFAQGLPPGASFTIVTPNTAVNRLFYDPGFTDAGVYNTLFYVRENNAPNAADSEWVAITVEEAGPQAPVFVDIPETAIASVGEEFSLWIQASDRDSGPPALSVEGSPEVPWNAVFVDSGNGHASFTLDADVSQADTIYTLSFIASDGALTDTAIVELSIIEYTAGDADGNGFVNISDVIYLIAYIFGGGPAPSPMAAGDADCSGTVNISDASFLVAFIFGDGSPPVLCP